VRDENSYWLVRGAASREAELVLDPVLQFPDIARAEAPADAESGRPYALVYGHGFPDWLQSMVVQWSRLTGIRLVSVGYRNPWADEHRIDACPREFAALVAGANAVITNFFHGCVFALVHGKPFVAAPSAYRFNKVRDLASALGAQRHIVTDATSSGELHALLGSALSSEISERIASSRQRSSAFLDAALR
jgi:hypothetical protein